MYKILASGIDFGNVSTILSFSGQISRQCVNISIAMDGVVEPEESFNVVLETSDPAVILGTSLVVIADSDSKCVYSCRTYTTIYAPNNILSITCSLPVHSGTN